MGGGGGRVDCGHPLFSQIEEPRRDEIIQGTGCEVGGYESHDGGFTRKCCSL